MNNFLKRIELQGFKSFAGKTVLDFPSSIVAVVGPNGSGKSNIIDALRWALGEREAKKLRGDTLDQLIFAGTNKKAAVGLAKVALCFDNKNRTFLEDAEEIVLLRKIDRSGESQFFWNDAEIKLKDLNQILAKARLGTRGLTMIGQGQGDLFVRSTPQERRTMIEEVLGLREFRLKKAEAERRLESSRINMEKVKAMIDELSPHLRFLRKQKSRFEKRSDIESDLREMENNYFSFNYHSLLKNMSLASTPLLDLQKEQKEEEKNISALENELKGLSKKAETLDRAREIRQYLQSLLDKKSIVEKEIGRIEARIEFEKSASSKTITITELTETVRSLISEIDELASVSDLEVVRDKLKDWSKKLKKSLGNNTEFDKSALKDGFSILKENILKLENEIKSLREEEEQVISEGDKANSEFREKVQNLELKKNELRVLDENLRRGSFEREKIELKLSELERNWQVVGRHVSELKSLPVVSEISNPEDLERKMMRFRGELAAIGEIDEILVKEAEESEKRFQFLSKESSDLDKAVTDLKNLIKDLDQKIHTDFKSSFRKINDEFNNYFRIMFGGGKAKLKLEVVKVKSILAEAASEVSEPRPEEPSVKEEGDPELRAGVDIELSLPKKKIKSIDMLSGGEKSLVSIAALFSLISVSPPPFLVLDEIDAPLDEENTRRFSEMIKEFSRHTQFIIVTHNRTTMEAADVLYGVTMGEDGVSKVLSLKLEDSVSMV
ncbi:MAG: AAA family ATPase [Patescibacteria group bacterium]